MFLDNFPQLDSESVFEIEWQDNPFSYDEQLYSLGKGLKEFVALNPRTDCSDLFYVNEIPDTEKCVVWHNGETWLGKYFKKGWRPYKGYLEIKIKPIEMVWSWNPDIDKLMQFEEDIYGKFEPLPWERKFKFVWYIDNRFNPLEDNVWVFSCQPKGLYDPIRKEMGFVTPKVNIEFNPILPKLSIDLDECYPPFWELVNECVYELDKDYIIEAPIWLLKITPGYRKPREWRVLGSIIPQYTLEYNPDLPILNYNIITKHNYHDLKYCHTYFLDRSHLTNNEPDIWAFKLKYVVEVEGDKNAGYIFPTFKIIKNPQFKNVNYEVDYKVPYTDLAYEHMWMLDKELTETSPEPIWAFKASAAKRSKGIKIIGEVKPIQYVEFNTDLKGFEFDIPTFDLTYHDLEYLHVWHIDSGLVNKDNVWAVTVSYVDNPKGMKEQGKIMPKQHLKINPSLRHIKADIDYSIPLHDAGYEHIWYLNYNNRKIWYAKLSTQTITIGNKEMGVVEPQIGKQLDVFFISYNEINADKNWSRLKQLCPRAKRLKNIKGIFNAHKTASEKSTTDMFYVVDADADLVDGFEFNFNPEIFERKYTFIWKSSNPFNNLEYGYGGVKLFPKLAFADKKISRSLDVFQSVSKGIKIVDKISNVTRFNTDEFSTWRSAFRETVKLLTNGQKKLVDRWVTKEDAFAEYARLGVYDGRQFFKANKLDFKILLQINDRDWLLDHFNRLYRSI